MMDYDKSNRSALLADAVLPYLKAGDSILDVGCGFAAHPKFQGTILPRLLHERLVGVRYHGIDHRADVIAECRNMYAEDEWTVVDASLFVPSRNYDAVFHLGFDRKDLSDAWKIHAALAPRIVLLEAGSPVGKPSKHIESFTEVGDAYVGRGYIIRANGAYKWTYPVTQPARRYLVLERGE